MKNWLISSGLLLILLTGCAGWTSAPHVATTCPPEDTWGIALASLQEFELRRIDKSQGVIETEWIAVHNPKTAAGGIFQRSMNQERARFILNITPEQQGSMITVKQIREFWSPQGVQSRAWRQIPPHEEQERQLATRIENKIKRQAC
jgi:hypothetical protein